VITFRIWQFILAKIMNIERLRYYEFILSARLHMQMEALKINSLPLVLSRTSCILKIEYWINF